MTFHNLGGTAYHSYIVPNSQYPMVYDVWYRRHCRYRLVGETVVVALWIGHSYFALYPQDRIAVRRRDVIGIYFPRYNPIPWSTADCRHGNEHLYKYNPYSVTMVLSGERDVVFDTGRQDWNPCRAYSVNATIMGQLGQYGLLLIFSKDDLVSAANNIASKYQKNCLVVYGMILYICLAFIKS